MGEPRLTAPQRRYEIIGDSNTVHRELLRAFGEQVPASFEVELADIYEDELPIPEEILRRTVGMHVLELVYRRRNGDVRAFGTAIHNRAETVNVHVPKDREKRSILELLDLDSLSRDK